MKSLFTIQNMSMENARTWKRLIGGEAPPADYREVRKQYRQAAPRHHPDKKGDPTNYILRNRPRYAFLYGVLCKRVKQKKKALTGRLFKSEVVNMLNKPLTKAEGKKAPAEVKLDACTPLHLEAFWHDLRLRSSFTESKSMLSVPASKPKRREVAVYF